MRKILIIMVGLVVALGACGSDDSAPSISESITETSWETDQGKLIIFQEDGMYGAGAATFTDVTSADREWGTWTVDGSVLTMMPDADSPNCGEVPGTYTVALVDDGNSLDVTVEDDDCGPRRADFSSGLTRTAG
jgi:hypothetical protein